MLFRSQPIYIPIDPDSEFFQSDIVPLHRLLLVHSNPFLIDRISNYQYKKSIMLGNNKLRKKSLEDFSNRVKLLGSSFVGIIEGVAGSGKTLFARELAQSIQRKDMRGAYHNWEKGKHINVFASQLNAISEKRSFNSWRIILSNMCSHIASEQKMDKGELIEKLIKESEEDLSDKLHIIEDLFSLKLPHGYDIKLQYHPKYDPIAFVKKQEYPEIIADSIILFIVDFFKYYISEDLKENTPNHNNKKPPVVIFLDDAQLMGRLASSQPLLPK